MTQLNQKHLGTVIGVGAAAIAAVLATMVTATASDSFAAGNHPAANPRAGVEDNVLASGLDETPAAWGQLPLTNPDTAAGITHYGYNTARLRRTDPGPA